MKYLVAHLLSGDAKRFHLALSRELSTRYHTLPLYERIPPHVTVKPPFETDETGITEVERTLRSLVAYERAPRLLFSGFGRFGFRTVYMDIVKSPDAVSMARRVIKTLNEHLPWMPVLPLEGNKLHASVARFLTRKQSRRVWRQLKSMGKPSFEATFDNIAILKKEGKVWEVHAYIALPAARGEEYAGYFIPEAAFAKN